MDLIQWHDSFSVGIQIIDEQHKQLFDLINQLVIAVDNKDNHHNLNTILNGLLEYTERHFRTEEEMFSIHPLYQSHCQTHAKFEAELKNLKFKEDANNSAYAEKLLKRVKHWLSHHILKIDIEFFSDIGYRQKQPFTELKDRLKLLSFHDKVLIAENDKTQSHLLKRHLEFAGFTVFEARNGIEALKIIEENFDLYLVITDIIMPEMDGLQLIREIREKHSEQIYIIVITISSDRETLTRSFELGANDFLQKPLFPQELTLRLKSGQRLLRLHSQDELIFSMAQLADCRSPETGKHLERVKEFTLLLGKQLAQDNPELGITESFSKDIARVSPLHDIGKVGIADGILNKPGKLTDYEYKIMKEHSKIGGDLISSILRKSTSKSLRLAFEITMYHHEKWDGSGYPLGLSGEDIPISARIMALADVYDALTTKRIYKDPFTREKSIEIIRESSGSHFDPVLVNAFEAVEEQFHQLRKKLSDIPESS